LTITTPTPEAVSPTSRGAIMSQDNARFHVH
jgi:hypothetical protein